MIVFVLIASSHTMAWGFRWLCDSGASNKSCMLVDGANILRKSGVGNRYVVTTSHYSILLPGSKYNAVVVYWSNWLVLCRLTPAWCNGYGVCIVILPDYILKQGWCWLITYDYMYWHEHVYSYAAAQHKRIRMYKHKLVCSSIYLNTWSWEVCKLTFPCLDALVCCLIYPRFLFLLQCISPIRHALHTVTYIHTYVHTIRNDALTRESFCFV